MAGFWQSIFTVTVISIVFIFTNGDSQETATTGLKDNSAFIVDRSGHTKFSTVQSAIDSVPSNNKNWITIIIRAGVYNEQVKIPKDKPFIYLQGDGIGRTKVVSGAHHSMLDSATFESLASNIVASGITFVNSYNYPPNTGKPVKPALAGKISGNKSAFYNCAFLGFQDTLLDDVGRHYFHQCTIEGSVDFIFGGGQSIYEKCQIRVNGGFSNPNGLSYIAAQARVSPSDTSGFVFVNCTVTGTGKAYLGRAWRAYSRVIFQGSSFSNIIVPPGWSAWDFVGHERNITFAEDSCIGSGSSKLGRVNWEKTLSAGELRYFTSSSYIDQEGWMSGLPIKKMWE